HLALRNVEMAGNGAVADDRDFQLREVDRFDYRLTVHHAIDDLVLALDPPVRMAVTHLVSEELLELCLVLRERRLSERLDRLVDCRFIGSFGKHWCVVQQAGRTERKRAGGSQITTAELHGLPPAIEF